MHQPKVLTRHHVAALIAAGDTIVINQGLVLRLNGWLDHHPGGRLVIQHMVGRDATDEISIYHSSKLIQSMNHYRIGRIEGNWVNFTPPIRGGLLARSTKNSATEIPTDTISIHAEQLSQFFSTTTPTLELNIDDNSPALHGPPMTIDNTQLVKQALEDDLDQYPSLDAVTQHAIVEKYRNLHQKIKDEGYYDCQYREYAKEMGRYLCIFMAFLIALRSGWYITSAALLGLFWHQIMFTAHDAGHQGITHNFVADTLIGMFIADFCCGLSIGWWKSSHNEHDPDLQNAPLFATSPSYLASFHSSYYNFTFLWDKAAEFAIPYQRYTYYPVMGIARFNLYLLSWCHLLSRRSTTLGSSKWTRPTEICFMSIYWFLFGYCLVWRSIPTWPLRIMFVLVSHIITMPLHVQITLSHWAMSTSDLGESESFPQHQLRTTMDVECPPWLDFIHGGLQFQAVHHLFPCVPRHNLRRLQQLVIGFCDETGIKYKRLGFVAGNKDVLGKLGEVAAQLELMIKCQKHMAETGESGLH
ncbi:MAG: hypothetical protein LQ339_008283 [Xanthoria mediterranea]|nr:MAG: hypothetical protein LQ339_008283 [Xanthoria mediterranea]